VFTARGRATVLGPTAVGWLGQLVAQGSTAVLFLVAVRLVDPAEFGRAAIGYGIAVASTQLVDLGAHARLLRDAALGSVSPDRLRSLAVDKAALALCVGPLPVVLASAATGSPAIALAAWLYAVLRAEILLAQALWQVDGQPARAATVIAAERLVTAALGSTLLAAGITAPAAIAAGLLAGAGIAAVPAGRRLARAAARPVPGPDAPRRPLDWRSARSAVRFGGHYAPLSLAVNLFLLDAALVGIVAGDAQAGHYGLGARLLGPFLVATTALSTALVPVAARRSGSIRRPFLLVTGGTLLGLGAVVAAAPPLVLLVAGPAQLAAVPAVRAFAVAAGAIALAQPVSSWLQTRGDERWVGRVVPVGHVLALVSAGVGAALGGATGAAISQMLVITVVAVLLVRRAWRLRRPSRSDRRRPGQAQGEGEGEVATGGVPEWRERHVPERDHQDEGLREQAGR
jgi:O-antigen/teichoic acid export membrane protein